ncbi:targeting protein for Xklp2 [Scomber scombrus]|uniref:Targeting protein for Xklp2 n=1 Tax=Scomber scombrus TaxID=13677 RepID=A0AAV1PU73_SCOSC
MADESPSGDGSRYEFDAPSYVTDFDQLETSDDTWFEQKASLGDGQLFTPMRNMEQEVSEEEPKAIEVPQVQDVEDDGPSTSGTSAAPNIVTCWGGGTSAHGGAKPKTRSSSRPPAQQRRVSKRKAETSAPEQPVVKNSVDDELERIKNLQKEVALRRKKNEASYKAALAGMPPPKKMALSTTVPEEFHLSTSSRTRSASKRAQKEADSSCRGAATYVPMAQAIQQYEKRIPDRYHLPSRQNLVKGPCPVKGNHLKLTQPHSPHLMTRQRSRPTGAKSSEDLEVEEVEKLQKNKFKANPKPKKILEKVVGVPEKKTVLPTVPESPAFALKNRVRVDKVEEVKPPSPVKAPPVPHFGLPFQPRLPEKHHVEVRPFSFEERERERRVLKEKKLQENRNEEVPEFKAQLLPCFDTVVLPVKVKVEPTKPKPFTLLTDERSSVKSSQQENLVKEEQKRQEEAAAFKARPNLVTHKEPFQPKLEHRTIMAVAPFELATDRRAREWEESKQLASEKETHRAMVDEDRRREEEQRVREEIVRLRHEQVHKAQPIRHYKPVLLKKSETPLTVPKSPNFSDRFAL